MSYGNHQRDPLLSSGAPTYGIAQIIQVRGILGVGKARDELLRCPRRPN